MTTPTPSQLRKYADDIERHQSTVSVEGCDPAWMAARLRDLAAREEELSRYKAHEGDEIVKELKSLYKWCSPQYGDPMKKAAARIVSDAVKLAEKEKELAAMKQRAEAAERKAEESARDAERYRWLRSKARLEYINPKAMEDSRMEWTFPRLFGMTCVMTEIPVDEAIDAAIAAKGEA